jgi:hypothetical protein
LLVGLGDDIAEPMEEHAGIARMLLIQQALGHRREDDRQLLGVDEATQRLPDRAAHRGETDRQQGLAGIL